MNSKKYNDVIYDLFAKYRKEKKPISINFRKIVSEIKNVDRLTHFIHPYPAKLLQHIPFFFLNNDIFSKENDTVLDPFCGSGSVLLEAKISKRNAIGVDVNPLASLIAKTKVSNVNTTSLKKNLNKLIKVFNSDKTKTFYVPNIQNLDYWYSSKNIDQLSKLKFHISKIKDNEIKDFFLTNFSLCCKKYSYSDPRVSVPVKINLKKFPQDHKLREVAVKNLNFIESSNVIDYFELQAIKNIEKLASFQNETSFNRNKTIIINKDIKNIDEKKELGKVDFIITSPPYVSAQKYIRASSLSLQWLEFEDTICELNKQSIGREYYPKKSYINFNCFGNKEIDRSLKKIYLRNPLRAFITYKYLIEMELTLKKLFSILVSNGYFVLVIGNNTIAGYEFLTYKYLQSIAENIGFSTKLILVDDIKSRGLMTKRNKAANIISREYIIILKKD